MNDEELTRYARHIMLDTWGLEAQEKLAHAHVLVIGIGGLACAALPYLAASGVKQLTLVDADHIALSNLQRQILFHTQDLGQAKVDIAQQRLLAINPHTTITAIKEFANAENLNQLLPSADVVLDCSDQFASRQLVNRLAVQHRKPLVFGSAMQFSGQIAVFDNNKPISPCYHCIFPKEDAIDLPPTSCALMGVFSPVVALVGTIQAAETLKILAGHTSPLLGSLLLVNARNWQWQRIHVARDPECEVCQR